MMQNVRETKTMMDVWMDKQNKQTDESTSLQCKIIFQKSL